MASNGISIITNLIKNGHLVQKVRGVTHRQHDDFISLISFFKERKQAKIPFYTMWLQ